MDVREEFGFQLGRLARWWRARLDEQMRPHGLTQARWIVLVHLARQADGYQQKDLARFVGVEGPTLVPILDKLEEHGLIERRLDDQDRRVKTVHLTDQGRAMHKEFARVATKLRRDFLKSITDDDLHHCMRVFEQVKRNAGEGLDGPPQALMNELEIASGSD